MKLKNDNNFDGIFEKRFSKRDLYTILQNMNQALYIIALNDKMEIDRFVEVNQAAHDQLGYSREEFLNLSPFEIIDLNDYHFLNEELQQHRGGGPVTIESTHFTKKGEKIPVEVSSRIITLGDNTKYILSTVRNIATSKETELLLERTLKQFESLFNKNPDIIFFLNVEGKFTKVNAAGEKILAYSMDELLSMSYESVIAPGDLGETKKQFQKVLKGNTALLEMSVITKNSKKNQFKYHSSPNNSTQ